MLHRSNAAENHDNICTFRLGCSKDVSKMNNFLGQSQQYREYLNSTLDCYSNGKEVFVSNEANYVLIIITGSLAFIALIMLYCGFRARSHDNARSRAISKAVTV